MFTRLCSYKNHIQTGTHTIRCLVLLLFNPSGSNEAFVYILELIKTSFVNNIQLIYPVFQSDYAFDHDSVNNLSILILKS